MAWFSPIQAWHELLNSNLTQFSQNRQLNHELHCVLHSFFPSGQNRIKIHNLYTVFPESAHFPYIYQHLLTVYTIHYYLIQYKILEWSGIAISFHHLFAKWKNTYIQLRHLSLGFYFMREHSWYCVLMIFNPIIAFYTSLAMGSVYSIFTTCIDVADADNAYHK